MPPTPTMGGLLQTTKDEWSAWTGGKPKADWTGLDPSAARVYQSPNQLRSLYVKTSQDSYNHRTTGLEDKFSDKDNLTQFADSILEKLEDCGMDTIAYLPAPDDPTQMISVVSNHSRFTLEWATNASEPLQTQFDDYDKANDKSAKVFLLDSLSKDLKEHLKLSLEPTFPFVVVWMRLVRLVTSTSVVKWETIKTSIRARLPSQYPGEDIILLSRDFQKDALQLTVAGHYDHHLTSDMLRIFLLSGGQSTQGDEFRHPLRNLCLSLETALKEVTFQEKSAATKHLAQKHLLYTDVCKRAEELYWQMKDGGRWQPAKHASDSTAVPKTFAALANLSEVELLTLIQQAGFAHPSVRVPATTARRKAIG
jgi:hypothetical protein